MAGPLISFYGAIMRREWFRLEAGQAEGAWREPRPDFVGRVAGPHLESVCRAFARSAGDELLGAPVGEVGAGVVSDPEARSQIEADVVVFAAAGPGRSRRVVSLGEVRWGEVMGRKHAGQLARAGGLLSASFGTSGCVLACYPAAGFSKGLRGAEEARLALVTLGGVYGAGAWRRLPGRGTGGRYPGRPVPSSGPA